MQPSDYPYFLAQVLGQVANAIKTLCDEVIPPDTVTKANMVALLAELHAQFPFVN